MNPKLKIAVFIDWYIPAFRAGGPIRSVANMVEQLKERFDFYIFTSCYDLGSSEPIDVEQNQWIEEDGVRIKYFSEENTKKNIFQSNLDLINPDIFYINSMYSRKFAIWPLRLAKKNDYKVVLAPRGMLNPGALNIKKNKKKAFLVYSKTMNWFDDITWHATSDEEERSIKEHISKNARVFQARNLTDVTETVYGRDIQKEKGKLKLVFLGRISKVKNLHGTLKILRDWNYASGKVSFDIYGPEEDADYSKQCKKLASGISDVDIQFKGQIPGDEVKEKLKNYHFLISSSTNENYGHAITEALSVGVPVIVSDQTPWRKLQEFGIGFDLPLDQKNDWFFALNKCLEMEQKEYQQKAENAAKFYAKKIVSGEDIENHKKLFNEAYGS